jgi:hypothetical protein
MSDINFQPVYIFPSELGMFGLPLASADSLIMDKVMQASTAIDVYCQKADSTGYGSLVYSTYTERVLLKRNGNPNVFRLTWRPLVGVSGAYISALEASGAIASLSGSTQPFDNDAMPSTALRLNTTSNEFCSILALSGRYGVTRNDDLFGGLIPLVSPQAMSQAIFAGPPIWYAIDPTMCEYDLRRGDVWAPAGLYWTRFSEIEVTYTSGFDPCNMPRNIKQATANVVKNMLTKPIPGVKSASFSDAAMNLSYSATYMDPWTQSLLAPFVNTVYG